VIPSPVSATAISPLTTRLIYDMMLLTDTQSVKE
jgi:hypothetical protein